MTFVNLYAIIGLFFCKFELLNTSALFRLDCATVSQHMHILILFIFVQYSSTGDRSILLIIIKRYRSIELQNNAWLMKL